MTAAAFAFAVSPADAQGRRAVRVVRPSRVIVTGAYYRPFYYRPFFYDPFYFGAYPYGGWYPPYYGYGPGFDVSGSMRLQVDPPQTEVFVDGYYAGTVDEFDGFFQRLHLEPGEHELQLYLPGHRTVERRIYLQPGRTFKLHQTMQPLGAGEAEPARPSPRQVPGAAAPPRYSSRPPVSGPSATRPGPSRPLPRRAPDRESTAESRFGSLALRVQPGDTVVMIDGERWEGTQDDERLVIQLGAGVHRIEIRKDGYRSYSNDVTIRGGETQQLNVALTKQ
jgi:hypothetical protein